jgi:hypothetical protein
VRTRSSFHVVLLAAVALNASCGGGSGEPEHKPLAASASATVTTDEERPQPSPSASTQVATPTPVQGAQPDPSASPAAMSGDTPAWVLGDAGPMQVSFKLSLYQKEGNAGTPVQPSQVFKTNDSIKVGASATQDGYIYLLHKGSTGRSKLLYPDTRINRGNNAVPKGSEVLIPAGAWFTFDANPGTETIYALYSTQKGDEVLRLLQDALGRATGTPTVEDEERSLTQAVNQTNDAASRRSLVRVLRLTHR